MLGALTAGRLVSGGVLLALGVVLILLGVWRRPKAAPAKPEPLPIV